MKTKLSIFLTAIAGVLISTMPAKAASMFGNQGIMFDKDTKVKFDFLQSNGSWKGTFGVVNLETGVEKILLQENLFADNDGWDKESLGTGGEGKAVENTKANFKFEAGEEYSFFLRSLRTEDYLEKNPNLEPETIQYSTNSENDYAWYQEKTVTVSGNHYDSSVDNMVVDRSQRALFVGDIFSGDGVNILWEDETAWADNDFDDFVVKAKSTPEPATLAGLGLVAGGMFLSRSKKQK